MIDGNERPRGRILVVDDEPVSRIFVCKQLLDEGFHVEEAHNGKEAVAKALSWEPELILMDIEMPDMDGIEACRRLKSLPQVASIPVIFFTGHRDDEPTTVEALTAGGSDFVSKDTATPVLVARLLSSLELYRAQREVVVANRELEAFSHALAHDLRNPLLIVTNFSHQLRETIGDSLGEEAADDLERIGTAGRHMMHIIDDLRDLGDVNRLEISRAEVDLSTMGQDIIDDLRVLVSDRDVAFVAEAGITALGDETLLRILLTNLLQNAWKYTGPKKEGARIELGVDESEDDVPIYYVRDNGIGFDNAERTEIFKAFKRLHTRLEFAGSGLGLATVERIVHRHGGRVWGEGVPGQGATFRFTLAGPSSDVYAAEGGPPAVAERTS